MGSTSRQRSRPGPRPTTLSMIFTSMTRPWAHLSRSGLVFSNHAGSILAAEVDNAQRQDRLRNWPWARFTQPRTWLVCFVDQSFQ